MDTEKTKYDKYVIREPLYRGRFAPILHVCGEDHQCGGDVCPGSTFPSFPVEQTLMCITEPLEMKAQLHAHDYDQLLYFIGSNPRNLYDFDAEIEITLGEEKEKQVITTSSIVYIPKGMLHCPINFKLVNKPIIFMHLSFSPIYSRSTGETESHPRSYEIYSPKEISKFKNALPH